MWHSTSQGSSFSPPEGQIKRLVIIEIDQIARMAKSADAADLKSVALRWVWGFKSPSGHQYKSR
jgi:hypothetical protein